MRSLKSAALSLLPCPLCGPQAKQLPTAGQYHANRIRCQKQLLVNQHMFGCTDSSTANSVDQQMLTAGESPHFSALEKFLAGLFFSITSRNVYHRVAAIAFQKSF